MLSERLDDDIVHDPEKWLLREQIQPKKGNGSGKRIGRLS
jgi:hypothetical protein